MFLLLKPNTAAFLKHIYCTLCVAMLFTYMLPANAQSSSGKAQVKKTTRVFYGQASFYANKFNGRKTASGEIFSQKK